MTFSPCDLPQVIEGAGSDRGALQQLTSELTRILAEVVGGAGVWPPGNDAAGRVCVVCIQEFAVGEWVGGDSDVVCDRIGLLEDMRMEWEQLQLLESHISDAPPTLVGTEEVCGIYVCLCACKCVCVCVCVCNYIVHMYMKVCMYVCLRACKR